MEQKKANEQDWLSLRGSCYLQRWGCGLSPQWSRLQSLAWPAGWGRLIQICFRCSISLPMQGWILRWGWERLGWEQEWVSLFPETFRQGSGWGLRETWEKVQAGICPNPVVREVSIIHWEAETDGPLRPREVGKARKNGTEVEDGTLDNPRDSGLLLCLSLVDLCWWVGHLKGLELYGLKCFKS